MIVVDASVVVASLIDSGEDGDWATEAMSGRALEDQEINVCGSSRMTMDTNRQSAANGVLGARQVERVDELHELLVQSHTIILTHQPVAVHPPAHPVRLGKQCGIRSTPAAANRVRHYRGPRLAASPGLMGLPYRVCACSSAHSCPREPLPAHTGRGSSNGVVPATERTSNSLPDAADRDQVPPGTLVAADARSRALGADRQKP